MAKISTNFFEHIIDGENPSWDTCRSKPETATQCLAAIVVLLAELVDSVNKAIETDDSAEQTTAVREVYRGIGPAKS